MVSPFLRVVLQLLFGLLTFAGIAGLWWLWSEWHEFKKEEKGSLVAIFALLFASLAAVGVRGFLYAGSRRGLAQDPDLTRYASSATPGQAWGNIGLGLLMVAVGAGLTLGSQWSPRFLSGKSYVFYGLLIAGAVQALGGASALARLAREKRSRSQDDNEQA